MTTDTTAAHPWITAPQIESEFARIPAGWVPVLHPTQYWPGSGTPDAERPREEERLMTAEIQLHGLGWGSDYTPEDDHPDGPAIDLDLDEHGLVDWCGCLPGRPVRGHHAEIGPAIAGAVAVIERMLAAEASA